VTFSIIFQSAHFGGIIAGFLVGLYHTKTVRVQTEDWKTTIFKNIVFYILTFSLIGSAFYMYSGPAYTYPIDTTVPGVTNDFLKELCSNDQFYQENLKNCQLIRMFPEIQNSTDLFAKLFFQK